MAKMLCLKEYVKIGLRDSKVVVLTEQIQTINLQVLLDENSVYLYYEPARQLEVERVQEEDLNDEKRNYLCTDVINQPQVKNTDFL